MAGVKALKFIQMGKETTVGTKVNSTFVWRGTGSVSDISEVTVVEEDIAVLGQPDRTYIGGYLSQFEMDAVAATYEQLPYIFEAGIEAETPTQDGAGSDYIYTYNKATTAQNTFNTYTVEGGDDQQEYEFGGGHVISYTLEGSAGEAVTVAATWQGQQLATGTKTAALTAPTGVDTILFQKGKIYVDDVGTYPATTQIEDTWIAFSYEWTTGRKSQGTGDGSLDWSFLKQIRPEGTLTLTFEHTASAVTQLSKFQAQTTQNVRMLFEGATHGTPGTTYSVNTWIADLTGIVTEISGLDDDDGNNIVEITMSLFHNMSDGTFGRNIVVNELSALP